jgi:hypothetical protein
LPVAEAAALSVVALFMLAVLVQPGSAWAEAAEHSKNFWYAWVEFSVAAGLAVPLIWGLRWSTMAWLAAWCGFAVFQPALLADFVDVRRHVGRHHTIVAADRRRARAAPVATPAATTLEPEPLGPALGEPAPIRWRAPDPEGATREVPATLSRPEGG